MLLVAVVCCQHWIGPNRAFHERHMRYVKLGVVETSGVIAAHLVSVVLVLKGSGAAALYLRELTAVVVTFCGLWAMGGVTLRRFRWLGREEWRAVLRRTEGRPGTGPRGATGGVPPDTFCGGRPRGPRGETGGVPPDTFCGGRPRGPRA